MTKQAWTSSTGMTSNNASAEPAVPVTGDGGLVAFPESSVRLRTVRLRMQISYDGTDFSGWAIQPTQRTIAGVVTDALMQILQVPVRLEVAGRTDTGVHATGQVAHVDLPVQVWSAAQSTLVRRLAGVLPLDVRVRALDVAPAHFHARFSGLARTYVYRVSDAEWGVEPLRRDVLHWPRPLDLEAMQAASAGLLGLREFAAFCRRRDGATTIRTLQSFRWVRRGDVLEATVQADAFCHSMVRSLVGAIIAVGDGRRGTAWPGELTALSERANDVQVAPAHGLTLVQVAYPPDDELAARNLETRNTRTL